MSLTNTQLDQLIEHQKANLREAIRAVAERGETYMFELCELKDSTTGASETVVCFFAPYAPSAILEGVARGFGEAQKRALQKVQGVPHEQPMVVRPS